MVIIQNHLLYPTAAKPFLPPASVIKLVYFHHLPPLHRLDQELSDLAAGFDRVRFTG